jgi:hypothetical protein
LKLPAHRAELPGKEMTRHGAPGYLRRRIIHPHPNPLINGKEAITLTSIPFDGLTALSLSKGSPLKGEEDQGKGFS